jgi:hypothetical protein
MQACSVNDVFARVQFWGEQTYSDLSLHRFGYPPVESRAIEYPLIGSISALCNYLIDASPLKVTFLHHPQNHQQLRTEEGVSSYVQPRPEIVGFAYIRDISISDLQKVSFEQEGTLKTIKLFLKRASPIISPDSGLECHKIDIGEAGFELFFRLLVRSDAAIARLNDCSSMQGLPARRAMHSSTTLPTNPPHEIPHYLNTMPPIAQPPSIIDCDCNQSNNDDSTRELSDFPVGGNEEKHSLLEELLDLCSDDMTIPTVDSAKTGVDPYEMWLSRIIKNASSPPAKGFPSLQAAGSHQSNAVRDIGKMKLEVTGINLFTKVASKLNGEYDFILEYDSPPLTYDRGKAMGVVDFVVCERFCKQHKGMASTRRTPPKDCKPRGNESVISLLKNVYTREMEIAFKSDDCVRMWLDGIVNFRLCYRTSILACNSKLPRVAMLVRKSRETNPVPKSSSTLCMAKACLRLRDVVLSDALSFDGIFDLVLINDELGEVGTKVGTLMVHIGLYADIKEACDSVTSSPPAAEETHILMKVPIPSSSSTPHPISILLSHYAGGSYNDDDVATSSSNSSNIKCVSSCQAGHLKINPNEQHASQQTVSVPPIWLDIRVERISKMTVDHINENSGCFKLGMSCSKQRLSMCNDSREFGKDPLEIFTLTTNDFNANEIICSWKIPIDPEDKRDDLATVTLHMWYCETASAKRLVGLANISFLMEPTDMSEGKLCYFLPCIVANSKFDFLDPKFHTPIGNVQVLVAVGSLGQVGALSTACECVVIIQRWWRRSRNFVKEKEARTIHQYLPTRDFPQRDHVSEFDTIHAGIVSQAVTRFRRCTRDSASSPDSLFDEWSQQSLLLHNDEYKSTVQHKGDEIQHAIPLASEREDINDLDYGSSQLDENESKTCDVMKEPKNDRPIRYEHFDLIVRLEKISGIRDILSAWCSEHGRVIRETLLSVSGFFVSFGFDNAIPTGEEELHKLCSDDDSWHSKLIPFEGITRDVEVNLKSMISVPDYEDDTAMILTQTLQFKLWFVPIITTTIAAMIDADKAKDIISLKGCTVISTAKFPLYHIYSVKGYYSGRVPWSIALYRHQREIFVGFISTSMHRVIIQPCPVRMLQAFDDECSPANQCHVMSTLKPTNLEVSFSHEHVENISQNVCIDPPEQIKPICLPPSSKRSSDESDESDECKRCKVTKNPGSHFSPPMAMVDDPLYEVWHKRTISNAHDTGEESKIINQGDNNCVECVICSDTTDDEISCRSLTSMIGSLDNINSKLVRGADPTVKVYASNDLLASFEVGLDGDAPGYELVDTPPETDVPSKKSKPDCPTYPKSDVSANKSKPDCPGRQIEPPDEQYVPRTPLYHKAKATSRDGDKVATSEKASSPMSTAGSSIGDENQDNPHESAEKPASGRNSEEPMTYGSSNCEVSASHERLLEDSLGRRVLDKLVQQYRDNDWGRQGEAPKRYGTVLSVPSNSCGILQRNLEDRRNSAVSRLIQPSIPSRFDYSTTNVNSWSGRVSSSTSNQRGSNAKMVNKERLERIFRGGETSSVVAPHDVPT